MSSDKEYGDIEPGRLTVGGGSPFFSLRHWQMLSYESIAGAVGGIVACLAVQALLSTKGTLSCPGKMTGDDADAVNLRARAEPWVGSMPNNIYPPATPTNYFPSAFPTDVGFQGEVGTGAEPALIATAPSQPLQTGAAALVAPAYSLFPNDRDNDQQVVWQVPGNFNIFRSWGNLSPWYSVPIGTFGIHEGPSPPVGCRVDGVYILYRHGARYPASDSGTATLAQSLAETYNEWNATGNLAFLNDWTYKLGEEILTAFGRQQEFDLGVSMRLKYGFLLNNFTAENRLPVFRTTSSNRMIATATNFALGFFGWPTEGQYELEVLIESSGFNNTLAPYASCVNANVDSRGVRGNYYAEAWIKIYLADAQKRIQADIKGFNLTIADVYYMQQMCVYETVSIGYSAFCELFTEEEWEGFGYSSDLGFWYDSAFGSPVGVVQGLGYVQELVSRLTQTPIEIYNSSTNSTLDSNPLTWPLGNALYADATHDVVIANVLTALGLQSLAKTGPLPATKIPSYRSFRTDQVTPFASNVQFQLLSCPATYGDSEDGKYIRIVVNDGVVPLTGAGKCPESTSGLCPLSTFIDAQRVTSETIDWAWGCLGNWTVPPGFEITDGLYPPPPPSA